MRCAAPRTCRRAEAAALLQKVRGIGPWTAGMVLGMRLGRPEPIPVGDFHLPSTIAWALAGEPRATDARMLELLAPFGDQAFRVVRLVWAARIEAPRRGPRAPVAVSRPSTIAHTLRRMPKPWRRRRDEFDTRRTVERLERTGTDSRCRRRMQMPELAPARELAIRASKPYPNDSDEYRKARTALIEKEIELRRQIQAVAGAATGAAPWR